jgi:hypothetical protein
MAKLARHGLQNLRLERCLGAALSSNPLADPLTAWDDFIRGRFFFRDEYNEVIRTVEHTADHFDRTGLIEGDCDCVSVFFAAGALRLGFRCRFIATRTEVENPEFTHVFTECLEGGLWRRFDATVAPEVVDREIEYERIVEYV